MGSYARICKKYGQLILAKTVPLSYIDIELYFKWNIDSCSRQNKQNFSMRIISYNILIFQAPINSSSLLLLTAGYVFGNP